MQRKHSTKRLFNLTGFDNEYKALVQLLAEAWQEQNDQMTTQDAIRRSLGNEAFRLGVTPAKIAARAAELDKADAMSKPCPECGGVVYDDLECNMGHWCGTPVVKEAKGT